ncbi:MAG: tandem-95 repeat protein, partial [Planctomycetota bacterium]
MDVRGSRMAAAFLAVFALSLALPARAEAAIGKVGSDITASNKTAGTQLQITIPAGQVLDGYSIIVCFTMDIASATGVTCADTAANNWCDNNTNDTRSSFGTTAGTGTGSYIFSAINVTGLSGGGTITLTHPNVTARSATAMVFRGIRACTQSGSLSNNYDRIGPADAKNTNTTPAATISSVTRQANELLVGAVGVEGPTTETFNAGSGWTATTPCGTGATDDNTNVVLFPEYRTVASTGTYTADGTLGSSRNWTTVIATYEEATDFASAPWNGHLYVATSGSDTTGDGSANNPWATVQKAATELANNGVTGPVTVHVAKGTYSISTQLEMDAVPGASSTNTITYEGSLRWSNGKKVIDETVLSGTVSTMVLLLRSKHVTLNGFRIATTSGTALKLDGTISCAIKNCHLSANNNSVNATVLEITNTASTTPVDNAITGCLIDATGSNGSYYGIKVAEGTNSLIANNLIYGAFASSCIDVTSGSSSGTRIYHNSARNTASGGNYVVLVENSSVNTAIRGNVFVRATGTAGYIIYRAGTATVSSIQYNAYYDTADSNPDDAALQFYGGGAVTFANWKALGYDYSGGAATGTYGDPGFVSGTDLHLSSTRPSPEACLDKGAPLSDVPDDFDLQARSATTPDIGGDEAVAPTPYSGDLYVDTAGSDTTGNGSSGSPWRTIQKASAQLAQNGVSGAVTVHVAKGTPGSPKTYSENVSVGAIEGASATNTITFQGATRTSGGQKVVDETEISAGSAVTLTLSGSSYVTFDGFKITNTAGPAADFSATTACALKNCHIVAGASGTGSYAVRLQNGTAGSQVSGCTIDTTAATEYGLRVIPGGAGNLIANNFVPGAFTLSSLYLGGSGTSGTKIYFNTIRNGYAAGGATTLKILDVEGGTGALIRNNIVVRAATASGYCHYLSSPSCASAIDHNVYYDTADSGLSADNHFYSTAGWTALPRIGTTNITAGSNVAVNPEYRIVAATGAYNAQGTLSVARDWSAAIATYAKDGAAGAIAKAADIGTNNSGDASVAGTTTTLSVPAGTAPDGSSVIVSFAVDGTRELVTCSDDTRSAYTRTYAEDKRQNAGSPGTGNVSTSILSAHGVNGLSSGGSLYVSLPNAQTARAMSVFRVRGLSGAPDHSNGAVGTGLSASSGTATSTNSELFFGAIGVEGGTDQAFSNSSGWTYDNTNWRSGTGTGTAAFATVNPIYRVSNGTYAADGNLGTATDWSAVVVTFPYSSTPDVAFLGRANSGNVSDKTLDIAIPAGVVSDGDSIVICCVSDGTSDAFSGGDTPYAIDARSDFPSPSNTNVTTVVFSRHNVSGLNGGGKTITVTHPSVNARAISASSFTGLKTGGALDKKSTANDSGTTAAASGATATTTTADELLLGAVGAEGPNSDTFTPGTDTIARFAEWRYLGYDTASSNGAYGDPGLVSASNLHLSSTRPGTEVCVEKAAALTSDVSDDYDLETRSATVPDIGADEAPAANTAPVAYDDTSSYTTNEDTELIISAPGVLGNDTDAESNPLTAVKTTDPSNGTVVLNSNGSFTYTPNGNFNGDDTFKYKANDGTNDSNEATVTIHVTAVNDAPTLTTIGTLGTATEDTDFNITYAMMASAANEADVDGDALSFRVEAVSSGTLTKGGVAVVPGTTLLSSGETLVWTPAANANGTLDAFTVKAWDGSLASATAVQVKVSVTAVNDAPVITEGATTTVTMSEDGSPTAFSLTLNATDADADTLTWSISSDASDGSASASGTGASKAISYAPDANFNGSDSFVVQVSDGNGGTDTITVNVTVQSVNDAPVITEGATTTVTM